MDEIVAEQFDGWNLDQEPDWDSDDDDDGIVFQLAIQMHEN